MSSSLTLILLLALAVFAICVGLALFLINRELKERTDGEYFESKQGPIFYKVYGRKGPTIVLIHGLGASTYCWRNIIPELTHKYRVICLDLWGFGHSSKNLKNKMTLDSQVEVIQELLNHLKVQKYHIVGHSMGAQIGLWLSHNDERCEKCVAITPSAHPNLVSDWLKMFRWIANLTPILLSASTIRMILVRSLQEPAFITEEMVDSYYEPYTEAAAHKCFAAAFDIIKDPRVYENLGTLRGEIHVVWTAHDTVISPKLTRLMTEKFDAHRTVTHPWSGHLPMEDDHLWLAKQILLSLES